MTEAQPRKGFPDKTARRDCPNGKVSKGLDFAILNCRIGTDLSVRGQQFWFVIE